MRNAECGIERHFTIRNPKSAIRNRIMEFTEDQILRYSRHILFPEVGGDGQEKILNAKVVLVGAGGLGSPVGYYLAAAVVGTIGVIDNDRVEISNLQRQIAHNTSRLGVLKADS